jgi:hypothetical protein
MILLVPTRRAVCAIAAQSMPCIAVTSGEPVFLEDGLRVHFVKPVVQIIDLVTGSPVVTEVPNSRERQAADLSSALVPMRRPA